MDINNLKAFKDWFTYYTGSFYFSREDDQKNIFLKVQHTLNVCENILFIAKDQALHQDDNFLAETTALFHDIGRFPQYAQYRTFRDSVSVNHGKLGADTLIENRILEPLPENEQYLILQSVRFHNAFSIPNLDNSHLTLFLKMVRDADKLDIWRVFSDYLEENKDERSSAAGLGLPDTPGYSGKLLSCIYENKIASLADLKTLNDFILMQFSWVFDLNFAVTFKLLKERDYIDRLALQLPQTEDIARAIEIVKDFTVQNAGYQNVMPVDE